MKAVIVDYGVGNIRSVTRVLESSVQVTGKSVDVVVTDDIAQVTTADMIVLPGVGSYQAATEQLLPWREELAGRIASGTPTLAVCLGMQLLFEKSEEGDGAGLGVIPGNVTELKAKQTPHMGWNTISPTDNVRDIINWAYFAHSFACRPVDESVIAGTTTYEEDTYPSIIRTDTILATQFHPEKSDVVGISLVHSFMKEVLS